MKRKSYSNAKYCLVIKGKVKPFKTKATAKDYAINNKVDVVHIFDSGKEAYRYIELIEMVATNEIKGLELQPKFTLSEKFTDWYTGKKHRAITYKADFKYYNNLKSQWFVEEVKGYKTREFRRTEKLFSKMSEGLGVAYIIT